MSNKFWRITMEITAVIMLVMGVIMFVNGHMADATYDMAFACFCLLTTLTIFKDEP